MHWLGFTCRRKLMFFCLNSFMRNIVLGIVLTLILLFVYKHYEKQKAEHLRLKESSTLIEKQVRNVGKLVVTEGAFSEVFTYKNSKAMFGNLLSSEKKALVVVNAEVTVAYDLSKINYNVDETRQTLTLIDIPEAELKIHPDLEYYDIQADYLNPFDADDYNAINKIVKKRLALKIEGSKLKENAQNRLISELSKFYILTNSLGWTLEYNNTPVSSTKTLDSLVYKFH